MSVFRLSLALAALLLAPAASARSADLHVMSFNLRFPGDTPPNSWPERRPVMRQLLQRERPDIIGTQEGLYRQLRDIADALPSHYDSIGLGREGGSRGAAMQIFYDARRLDPQEYDHSDTPNVDRIDWILTTPGVTVREASINTFSRGGQFPSAVQAVLTL